MKLYDANNGLNSIAYCYHKLLLRVQSLRVTSNTSLRHWTTIFNSTGWNTACHQEAESMQKNSL